MEYAFTFCFSLSIAQLMRHENSAFHGKGIKLKTFSPRYVSSLCGVVVRCSPVEVRWRCRVGVILCTFGFFRSFFFLSIFCVLDCLLKPCNSPPARMVQLFFWCLHDILHVVGVIFNIKFCIITPSISFDMRTWNPLCPAGTYPQI